MDRLRQAFLSSCGMECPKWLQQLVREQLDAGKSGKEARHALYREIYIRLKLCSSKRFASRLYESFFRGVKLFLKTAVYPRELTATIGEIFPECIEHKDVRKFKIWRLRYSEYVFLTAWTTKHQHATDRANGSSFWKRVTGTVRVALFYFVRLTMPNVDKCLFNMLRFAHFPAVWPDVLFLTIS